MNWDEEMLLDYHGTKVGTRVEHRIYKLAPFDPATGRRRAAVIHKVIIGIIGKVDCHEEDEEYYFDITLENDTSGDVYNMEDLYLDSTHEKYLEYMKDPATEVINLIRGIKPQDCAGEI